ncbi:MAG: hypothetical protein WDN24_05705 [Sphingomonas sp.]
MSRTTLLLGCTAFLLTSAAPPPVPAPSAGAGQDSRSPVRCRQGDRVADSSMRYATTPTGIAPPAPPPPPPPPPPPVSAQAPKTSEMIVSGSRIASGHVSGIPVAPAPYGAPGNTERYDGKEVGSIQAVADQPVSTFLGRRRHRRLCQCPPASSTKARRCRPRRCAPRR